jgi:hypothetical protein
MNIEVKNLFLPPQTAFRTQWFKKYRKYVVFCTFFRVPCLTRCLRRNYFHLITYIYPEIRRWLTLYKVQQSTFFPTPPKKTNSTIVTLSASSRSLVLSGKCVCVGGYGGKRWGGKHKGTRPGRSLLKNAHFSANGINVSHRFHRFQYKKKCLYIFKLSLI